MSFLYREAGRVLQGVESGKASLKTLTLGRTNIAGGGKEGDQNGPKRKVISRSLIGTLVCSSSGCLMGWTTVDVPQLAMRIAVAKNRFLGTASSRYICCFG